MKETFSGSELRAYAQNGVPQGGRGGSECARLQCRCAGCLKWLVLLCFVVAAAVCAYMCLRGPAKPVGEDKSAAESLPANKEPLP